MFNLALCRSWYQCRTASLPPSIRGGRTISQRNTCRVRLSGECASSRGGQDKATHTAITPPQPTLLLLHGSVPFYFYTCSLLSKSSFISSGPHKLHSKYDIFSSTSQVLLTDLGATSAVFFMKTELRYTSFPFIHLTSLYKR